MNIEIILLGILLICINELREWRLTKKLEVMRSDQEVDLSYLQDQLKSMNQLYAVQSNELMEIREFMNQLRDRLKLHSDLLEQSKAFSEKAQGDLETIVKEYKINGIPLGYQRRNIEQHYDSVEGL